MAQRARTGNGRAVFPRTGTFGTAAVSARQRFAWVWTRESLLRLGLAFVLSTALWLYVTSRSDPTQARDYPLPLTVATQGVAQNLTVANNLPSIHVRIQANFNTTPVLQSSFHPVADLSHYGRGTHDVPVNVGADPGIQVLSWTPTHVRVVLDTISEKHVPVRWKFFGRPPSGFTTTSPAANPSTVDVSGPQAALSQVAQAVVFVSLQGARSDVNGVYPVTLENSQNATVPAHLLSVQPFQVHVRVPIIPPSTGKTVPVIAAIRGQPRSGFGVVEITTSPATVTVYGSPSQLRSLSSIYTVAASVARQGPGTVNKSVKIQLPRGLYANTYFVTIHAQVRPISGSSYVEVPAVPLNPSPGLVVTVRPANVLVTVLGRSAALNAVRSARATLDLTNLPAGTYRLQPRIELPRGLQLNGVYPSSVIVTLTPK